MKHAVLAVAVMVVAFGCLAMEAYDAGRKAGQADIAEGQRRAENSQQLTQAAMGSIDRAIAAADSWKAASAGWESAAHRFESIAKSCVDARSGGGTR